MESNIPSSRRLGKYTRSVSAEAVYQLCEKLGPVDEVRRILAFHVFSRFYDGDGLEEIQKELSLITLEELELADLCPSFLWLAGSARADADDLEVLGELVLSAHLVGEPCCLSVIEVLAKNGLIANKRKYQQAVLEVTEDLGVTDERVAVLRLLGAQEELLERLEVRALCARATGDTALVPSLMDKLELLAQKEPSDVLVYESFESLPLETKVELYTDALTGGKHAFLQHTVVCEFSRRLEKGEMTSAFSLLAPGGIVKEIAFAVGASYEATLEASGIGKAFQQLCEAHREIGDKFLQEVPMLHQKGIDREFLRELASIALADQRTPVERRIQGAGLFLAEVNPADIGIRALLARLLRSINHPVEAYYNWLHVKRIHPDIISEEDMLQIPLELISLLLTEGCLDDAREVIKQSDLLRWQWSGPGMEARVILSHFVVRYAIRNRRYDIVRFVMLPPTQIFLWSTWEADIDLRRRTGGRGLAEVFSEYGAAAEQTRQKLENLSEDFARKCRHLDEYSREPLSIREALEEGASSDSLRSLLSKAIERRGGSSSARKSKKERATRDLKACCDVKSALDEVQLRLAEIESWLRQAVLGKRCDRNEIIEGLREEKSKVLRSAAVKQVYDDTINYLTGSKVWD